MSMREMSMREGEGDEGGDERCVNIDQNIKKRNSWKSSKEMKEYLRSEFEKKKEIYERKERSHSARLLLSFYLFIQYLHPYKY